MLSETDAVAGRTLVAAFEAPAPDDTLLAAPRLVIAAAGEGAGWRRASLLLSADADGSGGAGWVEAGVTAAAATMGSIETPPGAGSTAIADLRGAMVVRLAHDGMRLFDADDAGLDRGANLAAAGRELIQFGRAEPLGNNRWRVSRLLRGRRGTEWAAGEQAAGDRFVVLEPGTVRELSAPPGTRLVRVLATGAGDAAAASASATIDGASARPLSPVHLRWEAADPGEAVVRWIRRSRAGWRWIGGADAPLGEEAERYGITVTRSDGTTTSEERSEPWAAVPRGATVAVRQRGTLGESRAATIVVPD